MPIMGLGDRAADRPVSTARRAPNLVKTMLPPYEVPDLIVIGGVLVENRGDLPANNIKIVLEYAATERDRIHHLQVICDGEYILRGGGELQSFATLRLKQIGAGQRVVIYFSGPNLIQPHVTVTHYEG